MSMDFGSDIGFASTKYVTRRDSTGRLRLERGSFPSFVAPYTQSALSLNAHNDIVIEYNDLKYYVGDSAVRKSKGTRKEFSNWIDSIDWQVLFCATLASLTDKSTGTANVVVGLPLNDHSRQRESVKGKLEQTWSFSHMSNGQQSIRVESATIIPQAWGAILCCLLDVHGNVQDASLVESRQAVIDIGGHNVHYLAVDGLSDLPDESRATNRGAWTVMRRVRDYYDVSFPELNDLSDHIIMSHIINRQAYYGGECVDLTSIVNPLINDIATEVIDTAQTYFGQGLKTFRHVHIIGGGAYLIGDAIRNAFNHAIVFDLPEFTNAEGFYRYANYIRRRKGE